MKFARRFTATGGDPFAHVQYDVRKTRLPGAPDAEVEAPVGGDLLSRLDQVLAASPTTGSLQSYLLDPAVAVRISELRRQPGR